ncbi:MAG TPA: dethiobiotin synthase [Gammaproteobacteria bacterium]
MTALFVTATGTDVGKTYVTSLLVRALRARGRRVRALKPIATGFDAERPERSDAGVLLSSLGVPIDAAALDRVSPWRFAAPLSPDIASAREGRPIDWTALIARCRAELGAAAADDAVLLIEGIGGTMVPLDDRHTVLDWIVELDIPALLVAGSYLGTLSHTLTAAGMLTARGATIAGIVVDESPQQPVTPDETAGVLRRFVAPIPVIVVPRGATETPAPRADTDASQASSSAAEKLVALLDSL